MNSDFYGEDFVLNSGFPEYAVTNDIILIFPQAEQVYTKNPLGLWAYSPEAGVGLSEKDTFNTMYGPQAKQLKGMIDRVIEPVNAENYVYSDDADNLLERWGITIFLSGITSRFRMKMNFFFVIIPYMILTGA